MSMQQLLTAALAYEVCIHKLNTVTTTTTTVLRPFFWDQPGKPVPEENFWTLWCTGRLTEADTQTIWLGATSGWAPLHTD